MTDEEKIKHFDAMVQRNQENRWTPKWLASIGFEDIGITTTDSGEALKWPILRSPLGNRGGPGCHIYVDILMGCDGWEVGWENSRSMITPPNTKWEVLFLMHGLGIEPSFMKEPE